MAFQAKVKLDLNIGYVRQKVFSAVMTQLVKGAQNIAKDAKKDSPVRGGHRTFNPNQRIGGTNRQSISWKREGDTLAVFTTSGYGGYLEVGTKGRNGGRGMPERPYIFPAYEKNKTPIMNSLRGLI